VPNWSFVLADRAGNNLAELSTASGRVLTFTRNGVPEARMTISHEDDAAGLLLGELRNGIPLLRGYRNGTLRFHGYLAPFDETLEETTALNLVFRGPFGKLIGDGQSPGRFTAADRRFTATDAGQIAKGLIDDANTAGETGISTAGSIEATKTRDRSYQYANVGESIIALTRFLDGFDFEVVPTEYSAGKIGTFTVYARQGSVQPNARFEYGPATLANVRSVTRQTQPPRNAVTVLGANSTTIVATDQSSIAKYGRWEWQASATELVEVATLTDLAAALVRPNPIKVVKFTPDPTLAPSPWDDYWLGDTVQFYGRRDAFEEQIQMRVNTIQVVIDDEGNEAVEIEEPSGDLVIEAKVEGEIV